MKGSDDKQLYLCDRCWYSLWLPQSESVPLPLLILVRILPDFLRLLGSLEVYFDICLPLSRIILVDRHFLGKVV